VHVTTFSAAADQMRREDGGVLVAGVIFMVTVTLVLVVGLEIGNWFEHRRHLQRQVDAAALAGGQLFDECVNDPTNAFTTMQKLANEYGGFGGPYYDAVSTPYNRQAGTGGAYAGSVSRAFNSPSYPAGSHPSDSTPTGDPCSTGVFDVKATETGIPHMLHFSQLATVSAHARVELRQITQMNGLEPIAVPDNRFNFVFATFVNELNGTVLAGPVALSRSGTDAQGQQLWTTQSPVQVPINVADVGVKLRLVGSPDSSTPCGQLYTACYTDTGTNPGLVHIRGWSAPSTPQPPVQLHNVWLLAGTCSPDAYFTTADCSAGVQAEIDFGDRPLSGAGITTTVTASIAGGGTVTLTRGSLVSGTTYTWTATGGVGVVGPGPHDVTLTSNWQQTSGTWRGNTCRTNGSNPCRDNNNQLGVVQRAYEGSPDLSGPVQRVQIFEQNVSTSGSNSFRQGTSPSPTLGVTIATTGTLATQAAATAPLIYLRVAGSQNGSVDCDPNQPNLRSELANGCASTYVKNPSFTCPDYNALWGTAQPWPCVKLQTGGSVGQVAQGMQDRVLGGANTCTAPIHWPYNSDVYPNDTRVLPLIITPFGTFSGTGNDIVPVLDFGAFYVMGWNGDPCSSLNVPAGWVAGHFIKYIRRDSNGVGDAICYLNDPTQLSPCVGVMTK
jgi:hypothetical protein